MSVKLKNIMTNRWVIYLLISIPMTFGMIKVIENKYGVIFWIYIATMGISGLIASWYRGADHKSKFVIMVEHVCMVCAMTLFLWGAWDYFNEV